MTSAIISWTFTIPGKATALLLVGLVAVWLARRSRASVRHLLLATTFVAIAALPAGKFLLPGVAVPVPVAASPARPVAAVPSTPELTAMPVGTAGWQLPPAESLIQGVWIAGAMLLLLALGRDIWRLSRLRRDGLPAVHLQRLVHSLAGRQVEVLQHERVSAPLTFGVWKPVIVFPLDAGEWSEADLRRAIVHELEHVRRGDWATQLIVRAVCAVYWFHPLVWVAWRRLGLEAERACDDAVVQSDAHADYAEQLVSLAQRMSRQAQPALGMAKRSDLSARVAAILDGRQQRGRAGMPAAVLAVAAGCLVVAAIAPVQAIAQNNRTASRAVRAVDRALLEAAEEGDLAGMEELLNAGARVNASIHGDGSALIVAAREGRISAVRLLLSRGADVNLGVSGDGNPLIMAAREGHLEIVALLLDRGASIDQVVDGDENGLIQASGEGHLAVVQLLVSRGANVNARVWVRESSHAVGGEWRTPLSMARKGRRSNVVEFLLGKGARE